MTRPFLVRRHGVTRPPANRSPVRRVAGVCALAFAFALGACASFPTVRPEPPKVSVAGVRPLNVSLTKQRLEFRLKVENPNPYDLPLRSLDFVANVAGEKIASGRSDERVTIPAEGDAIVTVEVITGIDRLIGRVRSMIDDRTLELDYDVVGSVKLANWPRRIPFDVEGVLENPRAEPAPGPDSGSGGAEASATTGADAPARERDAR